MIKARVTNTVNGNVYLILGLTNENLQRLEANDPIGIIPRELGFTEVPDTIVILRGRNQADVAEQIARLTFTEQGIVFPKKKN